MSKQSVQNLIGRLNDLIGEHPASQIQKDTLNELEHFIHAWDQEPPAAASLITQLEARQLAWQEEHPQLANTLQELIRQLAAIGV